MAVHVCFGVWEGGVVRLPAMAVEGAVAQGGLGHVMLDESVGLLPRNDP